ncbi:MAG TPA: histidine kinase dimerization/phosphoacceptor domain -containing protein, partial [Cryomorphaceae bacterium]|nr:histidine kinase dimerization/phosphoacceptor domain -containing protein [Cryomorphaceae bacterium]
MTIVRAGTSESEVIVSLKAELSDESTSEDKLRIFNDLAWEYHTSNFDSADHYVEKALALAKATKNINWQAVSMEMKAILMEMSGNLDGALKLYLEVIPLRNELGGAGLENTFNNMAIIFRVQGNDRKALDYFEKSYALEVKNGNKAGMAGSLNNIAITLKNLDMRDSVPQLLKQSLQLAEEIKSDRLAMHSLINLGGWYFQENKNDSAFTYFTEALRLGGKVGDSASVCVSRIGIADILRMDGNYESAEREYKMALEMAISLHSLDYQTRAYRNLAELYKAKNEPQKAYEQLEKYLLLREELLSEELVRTTNELEQKYESARKEQEIAELELTAVAQNLSAVENQNQKRLLLLVAILLVGISGFVTYRFVNQRKVARILRTKNATIAEALSERELLLREIHHRVKNNLQVVSSLLSIQGREIKDEKAKSAISESKNRVHSMALIHQYLYSDKELASIDMEEYIPDLCRKLFNAYKLDHDLIDLRVDVEPISLDVDTAIPLGIIINELITNSLKYAFEAEDEGCIEIRFAERQNQLILTVNDNGKGLQDKERSDISFGMKLIRAFEEKLQAKIEILENDGYGVICTIGKYKRHWPKNTAS